MKVIGTKGELMRALTAARVAGASSYMGQCLIQLKHDLQPNASLAGNNFVERKDGGLDPRTLFTLNISGQRDYERVVTALVIERLGGTP